MDGRTIYVHRDAKIDDLPMDFAIFLRALQTDQWTDGWTNGPTDRQTNGLKSSNNRACSSRFQINGRGGQGRGLAVKGDAAAVVVTFLDAVLKGSGCVDEYGCEV